MAENKKIGQMKMIPIFVFLFLLCCRSSVDSSIIGRQVAEVAPANIQNFPYQLALERIKDNGYVQYCGATIIHHKWAVTSAICVSNVDESGCGADVGRISGRCFLFCIKLGGWGGPGGGGGGSCRSNKAGKEIGNILTLNGTELRLRSGSSYRGTSGNVHYVEKIIIHPEYNTSNKDYGVALIKVSTPFQYSMVAGNIPMASETPSVGTTVVVSGWGGFTSVGTVSQELQQANLTIKDYELCKDSETMTPRMFCVEEGICMGDAGAPLVANNSLVGIVSCNSTCGGHGRYTDVAKIRNWVNSTIEEN